MVPVVAGTRTDTDLIIMKFLVLALCVCAASAASVGFNNFPRTQPQRQVAKATVKTVVEEIAVAPVAAAKATYNAAQFVATAPVAAAKATYDAAKNFVPVVAAKSAYNSGKESDAAVLRSDSDVSSDSYTYFYETGNGIAGQASGILKKVDDAEVIVSQGSYRYIAPDGTPVEISYIADENGYQPQGNLLPVAPPVPVEILRSLEYIRNNPQKSTDKY